MSIATLPASVWRLVCASLTLTLPMSMSSLSRLTPRGRPAPSCAPLMSVLVAGQVLRLNLRRGEVLRVRVGGLWLTRAGDPADHIVQPGAGFVATRGGSVVVQAFGACACHFERHRLPGRGMRRWGRQGAGARGISSRE